MAGEKKTASDAAATVKWFIQNCFGIDSTSIKPEDVAAISKACHFALWCLGLKACETLPQ